MNWLRASLILQLALAVYFQLLIWLPLRDTAPDPVSIAVVAGFCLLPPALFFLAYRRRLRSVVGLCVPIYAACLAADVHWWVAQRLWPSFPHLVVPILLLSAILTAVTGLVILDREPHDPFPLWIFR